MNNGDKSKAEQLAEITLRVQKEKHDAQVRVAVDTFNEVARECEILATEGKDRYRVTYVPPLLEDMLVRNKFTIINRCNDGWIEITWMDEDYRKEHNMTNLIRM